MHKYDKQTTTYNEHDFDEDYLDTDEDECLYDILRENGFSYKEMQYDEDYE